MTEALTQATGGRAVVQTTQAGAAQAALMEETEEVVEILVDHQYALQIHHHHLLTKVLEEVLVEEEEMMIQVTTDLFLRHLLHLQVRDILQMTQHQSSSILPRQDIGSMVVRILFQLFRRLKVR